MKSRSQPSGRRYDSTGRRARAAATRRQIVAAAHDLFVEQGYAATAIAAVAKAAGVSGPTVYAAFGSKAGLLKVCIDIALAGDDEEAPVIARPLARWVYATDDPRELVERYAVMMGVLAGRAGPIYDVLVRAADAEPELSALLVDLEGQRLKAATILASAIAERGGLPPGRTLPQARDTIWLLNAPELYVTVTARRGWSSKRYVAWARTALIRLVLDDVIDDPIPRPDLTGSDAGP